MKNGANTTGLTIEASGDVSATYEGLYADHQGTGNVTINSTAVASTGNDGIFARNSARGGDISVTTTGLVQGDTDGIDLAQRGAGSVTLVAGETIGENSTAVEIDVENAMATTVDVTLNGNATGGFRGVYINQDGTGQVGLTLNEDVAITGNKADGVYIDSDGVGASILINGAERTSIAGARQGLKLTTIEGNITVQDIATIRGGTEDPNSPMFNPLTKRDGIYANSSGGAITIENIADITSQGGYAINAYSAGGAISIQNVAIPEFDADNDPNTPDIRSTDGIYANANAGSINIGAEATDGSTAIGDIKANDNGIRTLTNGGDTNIRVTGSIEAGEYGLYVRNSGTTGEINITVNDITTAGNRAIRIETDSTAETNVTIEGTVDAGSYAAVIATESGATVTVTDTGNVLDTISFAVAGSGPRDDSLYVNGYAADARMGTGDDLVNIGNSGSFGSLLGGSGTDTLSLATTTASTITNSGTNADAIRGFEIFNFDGDNITLDGDHFGWEQANFNLGTTFLAEDATLEAQTGTIAAGATLQARDRSTFTGNLFNNGMLMIGSSPGRFTVNGNFTQGAGGTLPIEFDGASGLGDYLDVSGTADIDGTLNILISNLPTVATNHEFLQALGGLNGTFSTVTDNLPDVDFTIDYTATTATILNIVAPPTPPSPPVPPSPPTPPVSPPTPPVSPPTPPVSPPTPPVSPPTPPVSPPVSPPTPPVSPPTPPNPGGNGGNNGGGNGSGGNNGGDGNGGTPGPVAPEQPLLSPKEIAPSSLMAGMFANDLFSDSLIQRRVTDSETGEWSFWSTGLGGLYDVGNKDGLSGWDGGTSGFTFGVQHAFDQDGLPILFGVSTGFTESDLDSGPSHALVDSVHIGGFVSTQIDGLLLSGAASYAWQDYDIQRVFLMSTGPVIAISETEGKASTFKTEAYYNLLWSDDGPSGVEFGPVLTADMATGSVNRFKETGAGILNLTYDSETAQQITIGAGAEGYYSTTVFGSILVNSGLRILWENVSGDTSITGDAWLSAISGGGFTPASVDLDKNRIMLGVDTTIHFSDKIYGYLRYDTTRSENFTEQEGWAGITFRF